MTKTKPYIKSSWKKFTDAGLLWWINRQLHLFGWVIVIQENDKGEVEDVFPSKYKFRGFDCDVENDCFCKLTKHISENIKTLLKDSK